MSLARQRLLVFLFPLILSLPFIGRAYFVDDSYFVEIASWLKDHPALPYHFRADDAGLQTRGWEEGGLVRMVNPLGHHYYLALLMRLGARKEWSLRLGDLLLSCLSALFIFSLARRWTGHPLSAALLVLATPVHWLTAHSLLIDATLGFFFMGGLWSFIHAMEEDSPGLAVASGLFMGCAGLTKYPGLLIVPLTAFWLALRWKATRRRWLALVPWGIALLFLAGYSLYTARLYGSPHILAAGQRGIRVFQWGKVTFLTFLSGATLAPLIAWSVVGVRTVLVGGLATFILALFLSSALGGFTATQAGLFSLWTATSIVFMAAPFLRKDGELRTKEGDVFLLAWLFGFAGMMVFVMPWTAARYFTIAVPAVGMLCARIAEVRWRERAGKVLSWMLAGTLALTLALAYADYQQAECGRRIIRDLARHGISGGPGRYYVGDSFTMSYLRGEGWIPCFPGTPLKRGDLILAKTVTMPWGWFKRAPVALAVAGVIDYPSRFPLKVMDYNGSAGFYASVWGALPFTFSMGPWERFVLYEVN